MFWNEPNLYGFNFPYKEFTQPQFPYMPQSMNFGPNVPMNFGPNVPMNFVPNVPKWVPQYALPFQTQYNYPAASFAPHLPPTQINPLFLQTAWNPYMHAYLNSPIFGTRPFGF